MVSDVAIRNGARVLTLLALVSFVGWIVLLQPIVLLAAIAFGVAAYALFLVDRGRHLEAPTGYGGPYEDRVQEGSETAVSPGVSAGGVPLSYVTRSRWRSKR